jgi:hypothetical protein
MEYVAMKNGIIYGVLLSTLIMSTHAMHKSFVVINVDTRKLSTFHLPKDEEAMTPIGPSLPSTFAITDNGQAGDIARGIICKRVSARSRTELGSQTLIVHLNLIRSESYHASFVSDDPIALGKILRETMDSLDSFFVQTNYLTRTRTLGIMKKFAQENIAAFGIQEPCLAKGRDGLTTNSVIVVYDITQMQNCYDYMNGKILSMSPKCGSD